MEFIIACDLEGIHGVVGEPDKALSASFDYQAAIEGAVEEINTATNALFDNGATKVIVWDNHKGGGNIDFSKLDPRIIKADTKNDRKRGDFSENYDISGIVYLGYHAKEGTPNGVLAHTYNSKSIQYVKLNGNAIGELYVDTRIFAEMGIKSIFHAGDDISVNEMNSVFPEAVTVITKHGKGRNSADLRPAEDVLRDIYDGVTEAVKRLAEPYSCSFPENAHLEIRYTRAERAEVMFNKAKTLGIPVRYGEDTHILHFEVKKAVEIPSLL